MPHRPTLHAFNPMPDDEPPIDPDLLFFALGGVGTAGVIVWILWSLGWF